MIKFLKQSVESFDFFGIPVQIYIKKNRFLKSLFGGTISLSIILLAIFFFISLLLQWRNFDKVKIVQSSDLKTSFEFLAENKNYTYELTYSNYYPKFAMYLNFMNTTILPFNEINRYFKLNAKKMDIFGNSLNLQVEACKFTLEKTYLKKEYLIDKEEDDNQIFYQCLQDSVNISIKPNQTMKAPILELIHFSIDYCQNSSTNNNSCSSLEEIHKYAKYLFLDVWVPKTNYDFRNIKDPRTRSYDIYYYTLDPELSKLIMINVVPTHLFKDKGLFTEDYEEDEIYFDIEHFHYDTLTRKYSEESSLFAIEFILSMGTKSYYLVNYKWNDILGNLGGTLNILLLIGKLICGFYNYLLIQHLIVTYTFSLNKTEKTENNNKRLSKFDSLRQFKFFKKRNLDDKIYTTALNSLHEYLDISKIMKRLQDIEKLKLVLFNENQRELFEKISKPKFSKEFDDFKFIKNGFSSLKGTVIIK